MSVFFCIFQTLNEFKFEFLRIISSHEHYIPLSLPLMRKGLIKTYKGEYEFYFHIYMHYFALSSVNNHNEVCNTGIRGAINEEKLDYNLIKILWFLNKPKPRITNFLITPLDFFLFKMISLSFNGLLGNDIVRGILGWWFMLCLPIIRKTEISLVKNWPSVNNGIEINCIWSKRFFV